MLREGKLVATAAQCSACGHYSPSTAILKHKHSTMNGKTFFYPEHYCLCITSALSAIPPKSILCSSPYPCSTSKAVKYTSMYKISMYSNNVNTFEMYRGLNYFVFYEYGSDIYSYHRLLTLKKHCII